MEKENTENSYQKFLEFCSSPDRELYYFGSPSYEKEQEEYRKLYEGLITSYNQDSVKSFLDKEFKKDIYLRKISTSHFLIKVFLENFDVDKYNKFKAALIKVDFTYGWMVSECTSVTNGKMLKGKNIDKLEEILANKSTNVLEADFLILQMEIKHSLKLFNDDIPEMVFHLSPTKYKHKILKRGLIPKSSNNKFDYPDRIYFFDNIDDVSTILSQIQKYNKETKWTIYFLNSGIFKASNYELYLDVLFPLKNGTSYFTKRNIGPSNIIDTMDINLKDYGAV